MSDKKIITVIGGTGAQGGSIVSTFLNDPELKSGWTVRAVTRDTNKPAAKKLVEQGAQVVSADLNDKASLVEAFKGSYAVFGVTNYWEKMSADLEIQQGKNLADAAKETGVQHFIWSSLLNIKELSKGELPNVYHFDSKAKVEDYIREIGIPATFFLPGFYMSNIGSEGGFFKPSPPDNAWTFALPASANAIIPLYWTGDTGKYIKGIVLNREQTLGKQVLGATEYLTAQEVVDTFAKVFPETGKTTRFYQLPEQTFRDYFKATGAPDFVVTEMYENMVLLDTFGYYGGKSLDETKELVKDHLTTWAEYIKDLAPGFKGLN
ncbi:NmrA-like family-domain-containing protein [Bombardia bombarda]|uniref:NmrA-like family domain-containing protein 1 n=1 Tax=Bombardia bombarda TaxID=252184 RepID=A0AA40BVZ8_9PEZI|nr:NmrA-like family-domain-containing protein [Bombardia bombarda]